MAAMTALGGAAPPVITGYRHGRDAGMLGMDQHRHHHRRGAQVGHRMLGNGGVDRIWLDLAQARACHRTASPPGMAPAVAVEHRQGPQVDAARPQLEDQRAGAGVEVGAAVMQDHALGIPVVPEV